MIPPECGVGCVRYKRTGKPRPSGPFCVYAACSVFRAEIHFPKYGDGGSRAEKGKTEEALKSYRAGLAIRERLVALEPANPQLQWDLLVLQWRLASSGDDPATRFGLIVSTMRDLAAKRQLSVEQARWLPAAEQELARVRRN